jgi:chemotaxis protein methyltransferase CheR
MSLKNRFLLFFCKKRNIINSSNIPAIAGNYIICNGGNKISMEKILGKTGGKMKKELQEIIRVMKLTYKLDLSIYDESFIIKLIEKRKEILGVKTIAEYVKYLIENSLEFDIFNRSLNINYSAFFRNPLTFALLEQLIIPRIINQKEGEIRIWSAGCAAGQEAYSIAMLLENCNIIRGKKMRFRIFATDISSPSLNSGRDGVYDTEELQNVRLRELNNYFIKKGETYQISAGIRNNVSFSTYDLLDPFSVNPPESIYGDFDLVFCSNLLFYYKPDIQKFILKKIQQSMSANGYLVTGEAERIFVDHINNLVMVVPPVAIFQIDKK